MVSTQNSLSVYPVCHAESMLIILFTLMIHLYAHLEYRITLMHAAVRSCTCSCCTDMDTSSTVHEQSERIEASKTARTREGPRHAFETAAEREAIKVCRKTTHIATAA